MSGSSKRKLSSKNIISKEKKMAGSSTSISPNSKSSSLESNQSRNDLLDEDLVPENINIKRQTYVSPKDLLKPIGILDPEGKNYNPLTNQPYQNLYPKTYVQQAENFWSKLPMYNIREEAIKAIYNHQVILVISGTGSGKTVLTPKFALHTLNYQGRIAITNPKRTPSGTNAKFAAQNLDVLLGDQVGLKHRDSEKEYYSKNSKLIYCTDGYLLAKLNSDEKLSDIDCVIIDEAHERGVNIDLLLLKLKNLCLIRPEFKLIIMSATISEEIFINYFPTSSYKFTKIYGGKESNKKVYEYFLDQIPIKKLPLVYHTQGSKKIIDTKGELEILDDKLYLEPMTDLMIEIIKKDIPGDILGFVGGKGSTQKGKDLFFKKIELKLPKMKNKIFCEQLYGGDINDEIKKLIMDKEFYKIKNPQFGRKIIFATEVAESSITIEGLKFVIDSGIVHSSRYYPETNLTALEKRFIPKSSHQQRLGRVGRREEGICYNLFTKQQYDDLFSPFARSPIFLENLSSIILTSLKNEVDHIKIPFKYNNEQVSSSKRKSDDSKNNTNIDKKELSYFLNSLIEPPVELSVIQTIERLDALDCFTKKSLPITDNSTEYIYRLSSVGLTITSMDLQPELGRLLISGHNYNCRNDIIDFISFCEVTENKIQRLFIDFDILQEELESRKLSSQQLKSKIKDLTKSYSLVINNFKSSMGDILGIINIINQFKQIRKDEEKVFDKWVKDNFISSSSINKILKNSYEIRKKFNNYLKLQQQRYPKINWNFISTDYSLKPYIYKDDNQIMNIFNCILDALTLNVAIKNPKINESKNYLNCFPHKSISSKLVENKNQTEIKTLLQATHPYSYIIYLSFNSIFSKSSLELITPVPKQYINQLYLGSYYQQKNLNTSEFSDSLKLSNSLNQKKNIIDRCIDHLQIEKVIKLSDTSKNIQSGKLKNKKKTKKKL